MMHIIYIKKKPPLKRWNDDVVQKTPNSAGCNFYPRGSRKIKDYMFGNNNIIKKTVTKLNVVGT